MSQRPQGAKRREGPPVDASLPVRRPREVPRGTQGEDPIEEGSPMQVTQEYAGTGGLTVQHRGAEENESKRVRSLEVKAQQHKDELPASTAAINSPMRKLRLRIPDWLANTNLREARQSLLQELQASNSKFSN